MYTKTLALALALSSAVSASPLNRRQDACQATYKSCIASGTPEVACQCDLTACVGEDAARIRSFCATATAGLVRSSSAAAPVPTSIPGGCNPAHPGSCPDSYFSTTVTSVKTITTNNPPSTLTPCATATTPAASPSKTPAASSHPAPAPTYAAGSNPVKTDKTWTVHSLTRYCGEGNTGCDYNFSITGADGKTDKCTVIRMPGSNAASESWADQPCGADSKYKLSWGYVAQPAPAFAVLSVVNGNEIAWFGVSDVNGQKVSPSNPFGSGQWGDITEAVYKYN